VTSALQHVGASRFIAARFAPLYAAVCASYLRGKTATAFGQSLTAQTSSDQNFSGFESRLREKSPQKTRVLILNTLPPLDTQQMFRACD
jgi:hypothetical protein